jgi:hypothetical protein
MPSHELYPTDARSGSEAQAVDPSVVWHEPAPIACACAIPTDAAKIRQASTPSTPSRRRPHHTNTLIRVPWPR